jgi:glutamate--cysteine ligase
VTLDRAKSDLERPIQGRADLVDYFRAGEKPAASWRVGLEHEKIGLYAADATTVPYEGERGIGALLQALGETDRWKAVCEAGRLVALDRDGASVTLEPGGQLELSGGPQTSLHETARELREHMDAVRQVSERFGIAWLALGSHPFSDTAELPRMPKERYRIMREYLPTRGALALDMMHATASVQASFDYSDEADMAAKMRLAAGINPIVAALFANSSLHRGRASGWISRRLEIWRHTDPARCGTPSFLFEDDFGYARYAEWALDVPMFFIVRDGHYTAMQGRSFREFLRNGHEGQRATLADFDRHLTTLFPDVRLKRLIEVRCADAVPLELVCAVPALWKGVFYDAHAREAAAALVRGVARDAREAAYDDVARRGLRASFDRRPVLDLARELVEIASAGLRRLAAEDAEGRDERIHLEPLHDLLARGVSPGESILERWEGEWQRRPERLIAGARY